MATIMARRPQHGDVTKIPTPPLQATALFLNFFFPAIALVVLSLRFYSRAWTRQWGLGACEPVLNLYNSIEPVANTIVLLQMTC